MLLRRGTGNAKVLVALWRAAAVVRVEAPAAYRESAWSYNTVTMIYSSPFCLSSWAHSLSGNAFSLTNGYTGREETETCGTFTSSCCWNPYTYIPTIPRDSSGKGKWCGEASCKQADGNLVCIKWGLLLFLNVLFLFSLLQTSWDFQNQVEHCISVHRW